MNPLAPLGRGLIVLGLALAAVGLILALADKIPFLGKLPGDVVIKRENWSFHFPLVTSLVVSLVLSLIFWLFRR